MSVSSNPPALKTKNPRKRKQFSPSTANTIRCVSQCRSFSPDLLTVSRGVAERKWTQDNPEGTKEMFRAYFEDLSDEKRQVCRTLASNDPTNLCLRNLQRWSRPLRPRLFRHLLGFKNVLTLPFIGSGTEEEKVTRLKTEPVPRLYAAPTRHYTPSRCRLFHCRLFTCPRIASTHSTHQNPGSLYLDLSHFVLIFLHFSRRFGTHIVGHRQRPGHRRCASTG